jgi:hypothetical protein
MAQGLYARKKIVSIKPGYSKNEEIWPMEGEGENN